MMILFLISSSACVVVITAVSLAIGTLVDQHDCLRRDLLMPKKKEADVVQRGCIWLGGLASATYEACCKGAAAGGAEEVEFVTVGSEEDCMDRTK